MTRAASPLVWVMMGVAGSGKTTVGRLLAARLDCDFLEGDRRHPRANIQKMAAYIPLTEGDRQQWLDAIAADIRQAIHLKREIVITCSALKRAHRQRLRALGPVQLVGLELPESVLCQRLNQRCHHYMPAQLLASQLEAFEAIGVEEAILTVNATLLPAEIVDQIWQQAIDRYPPLERAWWHR
ncbi:gluconokinase, GntK/IdnK-type [Acaryochloris sp. IP29b_bin.148]|uniref:gluconokinase n=1 Tax=Acaryochloris sp. IP29b_bin.148 TaxID=2969218 RepID=UPI00261F9160|nr:gluconokinase, GntK/IdnK-type [Acaryochloris sp. IP29b_bin.148]